MLRQRANTLTPITVLLVDQHAVVRNAYRRLLESNQDIRVVAEAGDSREALHCTLASHPDVVIVELAMPEASGIDITRCLLASRPQLPVLIYSLHDDPIFATRALQAGARGFICKVNAPEAIVRAVRCLAGGGCFFRR